MTTPSSTSQSVFSEPRGMIDVVVRADDRAGRLHEDDRLGRHRGAGLGGMVGVVEADADELADAGDAGADARHRRIDQRQAVGIEPAQLGRAPPDRAPRRAMSRDMAGEVADRAAGIEQARLLGARLRHNAASFMSSLSLECGSDRPAAVDGVAWPVVIGSRRRDRRRARRSPRACRAGPSAGGR